MIRALFLNETEKLMCRRKYTVFLVFDLLIGIVIALGHLLTEALSAGVFSSGTLFDHMLLNGFHLYMTLFIPLIALLACGDLFSGEVHDRSIRQILQRPPERWKVFLAKVLAVYTLCVTYVVLHFAMLFFVRLIFGHTADGALFALGAYLLDLIPMAVTVLFFAFLHQLVSAPASAVALSMVSYLLLLTLGSLMPVGSVLFFTEYLTWHTAWLGNPLPLSVLAPKIGILLGSGVLLYTLGQEAFDNKEV